MNHRNRKRQPEVESLETMELLSGAAAALPHGVASHLTAMVDRALHKSVGDVALNVSGTVRGTYRIVQGGSEARFTGSGSLAAPVGKAQVQGTIANGTSSGGGQLTLKLGSRGTIKASVTGVPSLGVYQYQIDGGTKTFAGDSGDGVAEVDILTANRAGTAGKFVMELQGLSST